MWWPVHHARDQPGDTRGTVPVRGLQWALQRLRALGAAQHRGYVMGQRRDARSVHLNQEVFHCPSRDPRIADQYRLSIWPEPHPDPRRLSPEPEHQGHASRYHSARSRFPDANP